MMPGCLRVAIKGRWIGCLNKFRYRHFDAFAEGGRGLIPLLGKEVPYCVGG